MTDLFTQSSATFSPCQRYRYTLARQWDDAQSCVIVMLNPSTATAEVSDPTVTRCIGYAKRWGYGGLIVANLFALRSTDPKELFRVDDPVGPENDLAIEEAAAGRDVVVAWGLSGPHKRRGPHHGRDRDILRLIRSVARRVDCLGVTQDGTPKHPLYLRSDQERIAWDKAGREDL